MFLSALLLLNANAQLSYSSDPGISMKKADSFYFAQDWSSARKIYEKLLGDTSQNSIAWNRLGFSDYNLGNYDKAMRCYKNALAFNRIPPVKASAFSRMARISALKNEKQKALIEMDSAL